MRKTLLSAALASVMITAIPSPSYADRPLRKNERVWQDSKGRYHCRRGNGTTGLVIGGVGGALIGRTIDTRGDRTVGTLLGAAGGAVLGREIDRRTARCR